MDYYGQVLGLYNFKGAVTVSDSTFMKMRLEHSSCDVGYNLSETTHKTLSEDETFNEGNSFTTKFTSSDRTARDYKTQVKNIISIRVDDETLVQQPISIYGNIFEDNAVIKGLVYLDLPQRTTEAVLLVGNAVSYTFSYYHTAVFHIRNQVTSVLSEAGMTAEA